MFLSVHTLHNPEQPRKPPTAPPTAHLQDILHPMAITPHHGHNSVQHTGRIRLGVQAPPHQRPKNGELVEGPSHRDHTLVTPTISGDNHGQGPTGDLHSALDNNLLERENSDSHKGTYCKDRPCMGGCTNPKDKTKIPDRFLDMGGTPWTFFNDNLQSWGCQHKGSQPQIGCTC